MTPSAAEGSRLEGPVKVGVLLSGRGSNFLALHEAMVRQEIPAQISLVVSNKPKAKGLQKAVELGIPTALLPHRGVARRAHDQQVVEALKSAGVEWVCLAGYMRLLSPVLVSAFPQRILNIHPSLLPSFPGLDAQRQALQHGVKISGCTVHLVDEGLDSGPIVVQRAVPVSDHDNEDSLAGKILVEEHKAYPLALRRLFTDSWRIEGRRVVFS